MFAVRMDAHMLCTLRTQQMNCKGYHDGTLVEMVLMVPVRLSDAVRRWA